MRLSLKHSRTGFTLIEVLATLLLLAIVMPSVMGGLALAEKVADRGRHKTVAAGLAQMEMHMILASQSWQNGGANGDFGTDWPGYAWQMAAASWPGDTLGAGLEEIDLKVTWGGAANPADSITICSMAYLRTTATSSTNGL